jgi:hypothetical protein
MPWQSTRKTRTCAARQLRWYRHIANKTLDSKSLWEKELYGEGLEAAPENDCLLQMPVQIATPYNEATP